MAAWGIDMRILGSVVLVVFYAIYIGKMMLQKRRGIQTDQIAKGNKKDKVFYVELFLKVATYSVVIVEVGSIFLVTPSLSKELITIGMLLSFVGDIVFAIAVITMKDSWRAGLAEKDETKMITNGIYKISRNPAFLGFDLVYIGILLMFFNWILFFFSLLAIVMLHIQILQEEPYLERVFGAAYIDYKSRVCRYFGRKTL